MKKINLSQLCYIPRCGKPLARGSICLNAPGATVTFARRRPPEPTKWVSGFLGFSQGFERTPWRTVQSLSPWSLIEDFSGNFQVETPSSRWEPELNTCFFSKLRFANKNILSIPLKLCSELFHAKFLNHVTMLWKVTTQHLLKSKRKGPISMKETSLRLSISLLNRCLSKNKKRPFYPFFFWCGETGNRSPTPSWKNNHPIIIRAFVQVITSSHDMWRTKIITSQLNIRKPQCFC